MNTDHDQAQRTGFPASSAGFGVPSLLYVALTLALTWPLAAGLTHDIPGDFGDPLFTSWVLAWDATHLGRGWWNANIFAPQPLSLAYSEHFLPQALQILPIYAVTKNPILCYNLLFLSTFVLSGLGMFLLGRELTGSRAAGFVAGFAYAFAPYRIASIPHLQVLSSAWMPFVLFGLRRHFATGRRASARRRRRRVDRAEPVVRLLPAVLQPGHRLLHRLGDHDSRIVERQADVAAAGERVAIVLAATAPFLLPYLELRRLGFNPRSLTETRRFSADVYAYFTADPNLRIWGSIAQAWPKAEGLLFPGLTIVVLAAIGGGARFEDADAKPGPVSSSACVWRGDPASRRHHAAARLIDPAARPQDHQPRARARRRGGRRRDHARGLAAGPRDRALLVDVASGDLLPDHDLRHRDVVRTGDSRERSTGGRDQPLHGVLRRRARLRRPARAGAIRHDRRRSVSRRWPRSASRRSIAGISGA